jgi:ATP-dependent DNA helicase RecG
VNMADLHNIVALGEDSSRQFKADVRNVDSLASEMAAFANSNGGTILIGVADNGSMPGLSSEDVLRINQLIGNAGGNAGKNAGPDSSAPQGKPEYDSG